MSSVSSQHYGIASGMLSTMRSMGMVTSLALVTVLFSILIGRVEITPDHYPALLKSIKIAFGIFSAICTLGIYFSMVRGENGQLS
jgi:hypothetical protein